MKGKQRGGSHGRMLEHSQQTVVGKRMSKGCVPYGIKRYRKIDPNVQRRFTIFKCA